MEKQPDSLLDEHARAVARIQEQVRRFHAEKRHFRIYHGSTSSTRTPDFQKDAIVDVSDLRRLFPVDAAAQTVQVEPNVPMDALAAHTLKVGFVPKCVMELKVRPSPKSLLARREMRVAEPRAQGITAGGGYSGMSGESAMFRHGPFQQICRSVDLVLGDGALVTASPTNERADLWEHAGGTLGTFGIVVRLTIELEPAKPYVDLVVSRIPGADAVVPSMEAAMTEGTPDFVDGIFFSAAQIVLMVGTMVTHPAARVFRTMQVHWFSSEIEKLATTSSLPTTVSLRLEDYLFRYDHGGFWGGKLAFAHFHVPQNRLTRRLADPFLDSRTCYRALHKSGLANEYVVQDFGIPASRAAQFVTYVQGRLPQCQLFLVPAKSVEQMQVASRFNKEFRGVFGERVYNVGVYGRGPADPEAFVTLNRDLEQYGKDECFGTKLLYARTYFTADEFWAVYDRAVYDEVRRKYKADGLPTMFDKLKADMDKRPKRRPIRGILETVVDKALGRTEYLLKK